MSEERIDPMDNDIRWFKDNYKSLRQQYPNSRYLAIINKEVLGENNDDLVLERRVLEKIGFCNFYLADFEGESHEKEPVGILEAIPRT